MFDVIVRTVSGSTYVIEAIGFGLCKVARASGHEVVGLEELPNSFTATVEAVGVHNSTRGPCTILAIDPVNNDRNFVTSAIEDVIPLVKGDRDFVLV